jgi:hypothetical protein
MKGPPLFCFGICALRLHAGLRRRIRLCDDYPHTKKRKTVDSDSEREVVPKRFASEERPGKLVCVATIRMPRFARIGGNDKVPVDSHSVKRSDVPDLVDNRRGVRCWGLAHGRSALEATTVAKIVCLAEVWWGQPV